MKSMDFQQLEAFEEQVYRARELFLAATHHPRRVEMLQILMTAETTLETAKAQVGLDDRRCDPQPWWIAWQTEHGRG